jgi:hypothetical protein
MRSAFTTSFGQDIQIISNYRSHFPPLVKVGYDPETAPSGEGFVGIVSDLYQFSMAMTWMDSILGKRACARLLDIGGNTGTIARLFKATGRAQSVACIDQIDFSRSIAEADIRSLIHEVSEAGKVGIGWDVAALAARWTWIGPLLAFNQLYPFYLPTIIQFWTIAPQADFSLDRYIVGDVYELDEKYDCVTMFSSLDWFDVEKMFRKAFDLLEAGGLFFVWCIYWWSPTPAPGVYGDFPFAMQRLTRDDLKRYFDEFHPDEALTALHSYDYFHQARPGLTVADYQRIGDSVGFEPINYHRLVWTGYRPKQLELSRSQFQDVLRDIGYFKENVTLLDLMTQSCFMLFRKPA